MKRIVATIAFGAIAASVPTSAADWTTQGPEAVQVAGNEDRPDADDSGRNVRDRDDRTLTPEDQGGSAALIERERDLGRRLARVQGNEDGAGASARKQRLDESEAVAHEQRDAVARRDAGPGQPAGDVRGAGIEVAIGQRAFLAGCRTNVLGR